MLSASDVLDGIPPDNAAAADLNSIKRYIFRSQWMKGLTSGDQRAEVTDLVLAGFVWDPSDVLDPTLNDQDDDGDGQPDDVVTI